VVGNGNRALDHGWRKRSGVNRSSGGKQRPDPQHPDVEQLRQESEPWPPRHRARYGRSGRMATGRTPYNTRVQQRYRPRALPRGLYRSLACPNDPQRPRRREFASRGFHGVQIPSAPRVSPGQAGLRAFRKGPGPRPQATRPSRAVRDRVPPLRPRPWPCMRTSVMRIDVVRSAHSPLDPNSSPP
jgi:hypothetical protein